MTIGSLYILRVESETPEPIYILKDLVESF